MAGTATATAAWTFKQALHDAAIALWKDTHPEVLVSWGPVTTSYQPDDSVAFVDVESDQDFATMSATNRTREETLRCEVEFWAFRPGEVDAALEAEQAVYGRLADLELHVRTIDTTLGGLVRYCRLLRHTSASAAFTRGSDQGALAGAIATFEAKVRITN